MFENNSYQIDNQNLYIYIYIFRQNSICFIPFKRECTPFYSYILFSLLLNNKKQYIPNKPLQANLLSACKPSHLLAVRFKASGEDLEIHFIEHLGFLLVKP